MCSASFQDTGYRGKAVEGLSMAFSTTAASPPEFRTAEVIQSGDE